MRGPQMRRPESTRPAKEGPEKSRSGRRYRLVIAAAATAVAVTAVALVVDSTGSGDVVGQIDEHPITRQDVAFHMSLQLRSVQNRIQVEQETSGPWDWEQEIDGVPARHLLQDAALEQLARDTQVFLLAREHGLVDDIGYQAMTEAMAAENAARRQAVDRGEIVYGTVEFAPREYYATVLTELETQLRRVLSADADGELYVGQAEIEARYDAEPENWATNVAAYHTERLRVPAPADAGERTELHEELGAMLATTDTLAEIAARFAGADVATETVDGSAQVSLRGPERDVLTQLTGLGIGDRTQAVEREGYLIVHELTGREVNRDEALEAYTTRIREAILAEKFEDLLSARIQASDTDIDLATVRSIDMEELEQ